MEKSILDKLTPDDLPVLLPSHPDDAEDSGVTVQPEQVPPATSQGEQVTGQPAPQ